LIGEFFQIKFMIAAEAFRLIHVKVSAINPIDAVRIPKKTDIVKIYIS